MVKRLNSVWIALILLRRFNMKGWKVFKVREGKLCSLFRCVGSLDGGIEFIEGKWNYPHLSCGPLTVLKSRRAARFLAANTDSTSRSSMRIRRCIYLTSRFDSVWTVYHCKRPISYLESQNPALLIKGQTDLASAVWICPEPSHHKKIKRGRR